MTETRSLHRKLAQVMYEAERIPKRGKAPQAMGGFAFVQVGDAADYIRKALAEKVITMMPTAVRVIGQIDRPTKAGGSMTTVDVLTEWTLTDGESGESIVIQSFGAGADGGDKYSGKAQTNAMKYALLMGFLLSTGDDPELGDVETAATRRTAPPAQPSGRRTTEPPPISDAEIAGLTDAAPPVAVATRRAAPEPRTGLTAHELIEEAKKAGKNKAHIATAIGCTLAEITARIGAMSDVERGVLADELNLDWRTS